MTSPAASSPSPIGLRPPPRRTPKRIRSRKDLADLQRLMTHALVQPLTKEDTLAPQWRDGRAIADVAAEFIKPNDRLNSVERLEIYARCYWYRITECMYDDCPGLRALLGERRFAGLAQAYLTKYPSRSFTLRNLCSRLTQFILEEPGLTAPDTALAHAVARFEWAQTHALDSASEPPLMPDDLADSPPTRLRLALQPYLSLLDLEWPVDEYVIAVKQREAQRAEASNTAIAAQREAMGKRVRRPRRVRTYLVVHRYKNRLYYKRVTAEGIAILTALGEGRTLSHAIAAGGPGLKPEQIREWFSEWMELGWFCKHPAGGGARRAK